MTAFVLYCSSNLFIIIFFFIGATDASACPGELTDIEEKECEQVENCCKQALCNGSPSNETDCHKYRLVKECIKTCDPEIWHKYDMTLKKLGYRECLTTSSTQEPSTMATSSLADANYTSTESSVEGTTKRCPNATSPRSFVRQYIYTILITLGLHNFVSLLITVFY
ncbi:hypothetical protein DdX_16506 [Ditylenchus destructor]|uniref:Uncharacterized protein n=1 Tax=Ditylenchus destructor TaxID=166010 RepID=A0AAD4MT07_9BILA|nr:hypothetical protein DdX_16506 [Ditylenchus destructor]